MTRGSSKHTHNIHTVLAGVVQKWLSACGRHSAVYAPSKSERELMAAVQQYNSDMLVLKGRLEKLCFR